MNKNLTIGLVLVVVIAFAGWMMIKSDTSINPTDSTSTTEDEISNDTGDQPQMEDGTIFCTADAKMCPDGSYVGRTGPDCEFAQCPVAPTTSAPTQKTITVTYTDNGFSPASVSIKSGDTVKFINNSGNSMWVGADDHPSHTTYSGTSLTSHCASGTSAFDQCTSVENGGEWTFKFDKTGTWGYHNHRRAGHSGVVIVTQ